MAGSRLPVEILEAILLFNSLSPTHWQAIRLVCKQFYIIVTPKLFSGLTAWLEKTCLERLISISKHELLRSHVVRFEIQITGTFGDPYHNRFRSGDEDVDGSEEMYIREDFLRKLALEGAVMEPHAQLTFDNAGSVLNKPQWGREELERAFKSYRTFVRQQYDLLYTGMAQALLTRALSNFPNLRHVQITSLPDDDEYKPLPAWGIRAMEEKTFISMHHQVPHYQSHHLEKILCAMVCSDLSLSSLELNEYSWESLTYQFREMAKTAWRSVECVTVTLAETASVYDSITETRLRQMLKVLPKITKLKILDAQTATEFNISNILEGHTRASLKYLQSLELSKLRFNPEALSTFIQQHKTLSHLHLCSVKAIGPGGIWATINAIRKAPHMKEVVIRGSLMEHHWDCTPRGHSVEFEDELQVERFVMRKTDDKPRLRRVVCECFVGYPIEMLPNAAFDRHLADMMSNTAIVQ